jgi:NAD(P)-dependent dehydrogenase (short-subunit alcohol dehydrogenase family)
MEHASFVVVGGNSGIGFDITSRLVDRGFAVTVLSRSEGGTTDLPRVSHLTLDITHDEIDSQQLPERIQGMVYCPGSIRLRPFHRLRDTDFESDWRINLLGAVKSVQACLPGMKKAEPPASVVLFSTVAVGTGMPFHASIASAKGAVEGLTRSLAAEFAPKIRFNAIAPSLTDTPLAKTLLSDDGKRQAAADRHPLKRVGTPADSAALATFLLDSAASSWISGQVLAVDGGMGALRTFK